MTIKYTCSLELRSQVKIGNLGREHGPLVCGRSAQIGNSSFQQSSLLAVQRRNLEANYLLRDDLHFRGSLESSLAPFSLFQPLG